MGEAWMVPVTWTTYLLSRISPHLSLGRFLDFRNLGTSCAQPRRCRPAAFSQCDFASGPWSSLEQQAPKSVPLPLAALTWDPTSRSGKLLEIRSSVPITDSDLAAQVSVGNKVFKQLHIRSRNALARSLFFSVLPRCSRCHNLRMPSIWSVPN